MTVSVFATPFPRPWRGYDEPGLPTGMYIAQGTVLGDASGGDQIVIFEFQDEDAATSVRYWNIEQFECHIDAESTVNSFIEFNNFDSEGLTEIRDRELTFDLAANARGFSAVLYNQLPQFPIFLGGTTRTPGGVSQVLVGAGNSNGRTLDATIQGFIWEPRSLLGPGGLRRPADSLYGH